MTKIPDASIFKRLLVFDVSFNEITSLHGLSTVSNTLKELYVSKNEVSKMEELDHFLQLQILELGSNRLRVCSLNLLLNIFHISISLPYEFYLCFLERAVIIIIVRMKFRRSFMRYFLLYSLYAIIDAMHMVNQKSFKIIVDYSLLKN